jgi:hypothetical protein
MAARLKSILAFVLSLGLVSGLGAGQPRDVSFVAAHDRSEQRYVLVLPEAYDFTQPHDLLICPHGHGVDRWQFVREERGEARPARAIAAQYSMIRVSPDYRASTSKPVRVSVAINGKAILPAPGSAAGLWFYADGDTGSQALLTGHAAAPGSWRMTAVLNTGDEVQVSFVPNGAELANVKFHAEPLSPAALRCSAEANALVVKAVSGPGAVRLTQFVFHDGPACFAPERRPFSRGPVTASPDPHPAIADALVEWDWRMQDGIQTPRESRTYRQAIEKIVRQTDALVAERLGSKTLSSDEESAWKTLRAAGLPPADDASAGEVRWLEIHRLAFGPSPTLYDFDTPVTQYWRSPLVEPWREQTVPEEEKRWPGHCYKSPWPLSETFFVVSYSFDQLVGEPGPNIPNMFGLYFADAFGNKELIYRDPAISSLWARPLASRPSPPELATSGREAGEESGTFFLRNVMESWPSLPGNTPITHLRIVQVLLKTTPHADSPSVGAAFAAPGKQVLGTVPVEADGSALFEVPARIPVLFQALNAQGRAVQTMRSLVYLQPGEYRSCIGCHEHRMKTASPGAPAQALRRAPSKIKPGPDGSRPFSYPRLVQPVLDRHCVTCHNGKELKRPILTSEPEGAFTKSYNALVSRVSFSAWGRPEQNFEPMTEPLRFGAVASPLTRMLDQGHGKVTLTPEEEERLCTWIDANALFYGTFDVNEQRKQLVGQAIDGPKE